MIRFVYRWLEYWYRKQRQFVCRSQTWTEDAFATPIHSTVFMSTPAAAVATATAVGEETADDRSGDATCNIDENRFENELREVTCSNKNSEQLIEVYTDRYLMHRNAKSNGNSYCVPPFTHESYSCMNAYKHA